MDDEKSWLPNPRSWLGAGVHDITVRPLTLILLVSCSTPEERAFGAQKDVHRQTLELDDSLFNEGVQGKTNNPEETAVKTNEIVYLRQKLNLLQPELRSLIIMRDIQNCSYQEISETLSIPLGTTKSRINRARLKLAKIILKEGK